MATLSKRIHSFLRWSEKYTKTDMVYLASGGFWLGSAQLIASIAGLILTIALANLLAPEVLGEYRFLMSALLIITICAMPGMRSALMESTPKGFLKNIKTAFTTMFAWSVIGSLISVSIAWHYFAEGNLTLAAGFVVMAITLPFLDSSAVYLEYLKSLKKFRLVATYTLVTRLILLVTVVGTALFYPQNAWLILIAFLLAHIVPNLYFHFKTVRSFTNSQSRSDPELTNYARHLSIIAALGLTAAQLDKLFVWHYLGAEELAIFFIASTIPLEAGRFFGIVSTLAFPKFATTHPSAVRATLLPKVWKYFVVIFVLALTYILFCPLIFKVLFPHYINSVPYSQIIILSTIVLAFTPLETYFVANKRKGFLYFLAFVVPSIRIFSGLILIANFGLWGAVYALLIEAVVKILCLLVYFYLDKTENNLKQTFSH